MRDSLGYRHRIGIIAPSTNTIVEPEMNAMRPRGVTNHFSGIMVKNSTVIGNDAFSQLMEDIRLAMDDAVENVMTAEPDRLVLGISSESFWGGMSGAKKLESDMLTLTRGVPVTSAAFAIVDVLRNIYNVRRIAILTPYMEVGDREVQAYFEEAGFDVVAINGLRCTSPTSIAQVPAITLRESVLDLNKSDAQCIVQLGTNLPFARLAAEAEFWLDKPVLAINSVIYWHALRASSIPDQVDGFGTLLAHH
jgi:maleate isomerase